MGSPPRLQPLAGKVRTVAATMLRRHERPIDPISNLKGGVGALLGMLVVGQLAHMTDLPLLIAPLGATAALLFGQPSSRLAQPVNLMGGYLIGTIACEGAFYAFPGAWIATAVAVACAVIAMRALRVTHPPAGAMPILGFGEEVHGAELFVVVLVGSLILVALALVIHRIPPRRPYPRLEQEDDD